jgi:hypothetical protein
MIRTAEEFVELRCSEDPELYWRAAHEAASEAVWLDVIQRYPDMKFWVAQNKTVPLSILERLLDDPDDNVRCMVASKRKATPEMLARLAADPHESVRFRVAANRSTPRWVLEKLTNDPWYRVAEVARQRLDTLG